MKLDELLKGLCSVDAAADARFASVTLNRINADSRSTKSGDLFVAITGAKDDGLRFVEKALASGAVAVMAQHAPPRALPARIAFIKVSNVRRALALAAAFLPRQPEVIAAVTGTSGKTRSPPLRARSGQRWATRPRALARSDWSRREREIYGSLTTPDPIALHRSLDDLAGNGVTHLAIEASSTGSINIGSMACEWRPAASPI